MEVPLTLPDLTTSNQPSCQIISCTGQRNDDQSRRTLTQMLNQGRNGNKEIKNVLPSI